MSKITYAIERIEPIAILEFRGMWTFHFSLQVPKLRSQSKENLRVPIVYSLMGPDTASY
jgi:hypothetical protein